MSIFRVNACGLIAMLFLIAVFDEARGGYGVKKGMAEVNGTSLYYEVAGRGAPVVFISGGGLLDSRAWDEQFEALSKSYKVIRYDIRGIGKSARPSVPFSHSMDLYALLKFLKIRRAHVVALSFAGAIATDFALDHPEMVDRMILAATGSSSDALGEANLQSLGMLSALVKKDGLARVVELILDTPSFIAADNSKGREKVRQIYLDNRDVFENDFPLVKLWQPTAPPAARRLSEIRASALVMIGENDSPEYKSMTEKLASSIGGAKKILIPGAAHAINLDKPREFNRAVTEFLSKK